jgi:hypothetical protein
MLRKLACTKKFKWRWAPNSQLSKMFSMPFGIGLDGKEVDTFLIEKICKLLNFLNTIHLLIVGWPIIVNFVLALTLWFFISILGGTKKLIRKCKYLLQNFLWVRGDQCTKTKVN